MTSSQFTSSLYFHVTLLNLHILASSITTAATAPSDYESQSKDEHSTFPVISKTPEVLHSHDSQTPTISRVESRQSRPSSGLQPEADTAHHDGDSQSPLPVEAESTETEEMRLLRAYGIVVPHWDEIVLQNPLALTDLIHRGVPEPLRAVVWPLIMRTRDIIIDTPLLGSVTHIPRNKFTPSYPTLITQVQQSLSSLQTSAYLIHVYPTELTARKSHSAGCVSHIPSRAYDCTGWRRRTTASIEHLQGVLSYRHGG